MSERIKDMPEQAAFEKVVVALTMLKPEDRVSVMDWVEDCFCRGCGHPAPPLGEACSGCGCYRSKGGT